MARFIGYVSGMKGEASRLGSVNSGIQARGQGFQIGAAIAVSADGNDDVVSVRITGGSNNGNLNHCLGLWKLDEKSRLLRKIKGQWSPVDPICEVCGKPMEKVSTTYGCDNHHLHEIRR